MTRLREPSRRRPPLAEFPPLLRHDSCGWEGVEAPGWFSASGAASALPKRRKFYMKQDRDHFVPGEQDLECGPNAGGPDLAHNYDS